MKAVFLKAVAFVACVWTWACHADDRLWVPATINGKPARLGFDTGASDVILWRAGAERLGLKFTAPLTNMALAPGKVPLGETEECTLRLWGMKVRTRFYIIDLPDFLHPTNFDGLIGWNPISRNVVRIDAAERKISFLRALPKEESHWTRLRVHVQSAILQLEMPTRDKTKEILEVDTGDDRGVALAPHRWEEWKSVHPLQAETLNAFFMPGSGIVVAEETWAKELSLGPIVLHEVPVSEASPTQAALGSPQFAGTLGLAALKQLDLIVDGKRGWAYLRSKSSGAFAYEHNRAGAVFVPADLERDQLVARVLDGSPAYEAGVRNGDILLNIDGSDFSHLQKGSDNQPNRAFHERPAGSKVALTLQRGGQTFKTTVTLREIIGPQESGLNETATSSKATDSHGAHSLRSEPRS